MFTLLKVTIFDAGFWIGGALFALAEAGWLYYNGSTLIWKKKK